MYNRARSSRAVGSLRCWLRGNALWHTSHSIAHWTPTAALLVPGQLQSRRTRGRTRGRDTRADAVPTDTLRDAQKPPSTSPHFGDGIDVPTWRQRRRICAETCAVAGHVPARRWTRRRRRPGSVTFLNANLSSSRLRSSEAQRWIRAQMQCATRCSPLLPLHPRVNRTSLSTPRRAPGLTSSGGDKPQRSVGVSCLKPLPAGMTEAQKRTPQHAQQWRWRRFGRTYEVCQIRADSVRVPCTACRNVRTLWIISKKARISSFKTRFCNCARNSFPATSWRATPGCLSDCPGRHSRERGAPLSTSARDAKCHGGTRRNPTALRMWANSIATRATGTLEWHKEGATRLHPHSRTLRLPFWIQPDLYLTRHVRFVWPVSLHN